MTKCLSPNLRLITAFPVFSDHIVVIPLSAAGLRTRAATGAPVLLQVKKSKNGRGSNTSDYAGNGPPKDVLNGRFDSLTS